MAGSGDSVQAGDASFSSTLLAMEGSELPAKKPARNCRRAADLSHKAENKVQQLSIWFYPGARFPCFMAGTCRFEPDGSFYRVSCPIEER
jgi:hypothetical protein